MNHLSDNTCTYCNSTLVRRSGRPHCSGDNLHEVRTIFDNILSLEHSSPSEFTYRVDNLVGNEDNYDLFVDYWERKKVDKNAYIKCLHENTYFRDTSEEPGRLPIPDPFIPFPDLAEVYIAEIMLGRELTPNEKDGTRFIPKIEQETGSHYFAPLRWIKWPTDYISLKDMTMKTDYDEPLMPVVFVVEDIRNIYVRRDGYMKDE